LDMGMQQSRSWLVDCSIARLVGWQALRDEKARAAEAEAEAEAEIGRAEKATEGVREEMRRSVGAERQRVAGMLYKEALQTHTLEEQTMQLETLNAEIAETRQELTEAKQAVAEMAERLAGRDSELGALRVDMQALSESRSEHVNSILTLDESLALEQQTRMEQERVVAELQQSLTARTAKEAATDKRASEAESSLAALKRSYRELRLQVAAINLKRASASTQTESYTPTGTAVQTDWQTVHMPLPTPAGGK